MHIKAILNNDILNDIIFGATVYNRQNYFSSKDRYNIIKFMWLYIYNMLTLEKYKHQNIHKKVKIILTLLTKINFISIQY